MTRTGPSDLDAYRGIEQFGPAYARMFGRDTHEPGSVDRVLLDRMVRLCPETVGLLYASPDANVPRYIAGSRPMLEACLADANGTLAGIVTYCQQLTSRSPQTFEALRFGGTEEQIIERGSDWCADLARVACALCQVAGQHARMVFLANPGVPYQGHVMIEAWQDGHWGAVDPVAGIIIADHDGNPVSAWSLIARPERIKSHPTGIFTHAAITDYPIQDAGRYDYAVSGLNDYYRSVLVMDLGGWPGGRRWLHGEDR